MAHAIDDTTGQAEVFVTGEPAWHKLGRTIEKAASSAEAIGLAGLDWRVEQWPVRAFDPDHPATEVAIPDTVANVRATSHQTLTEQIEARAFTWLDRQGFGVGDPRLTASGVTHPAVVEAVQHRADWLIAQGYAERPESDLGGVRLLPGAIRRLTADERGAADRKLNERHGRPLVKLPPGGAVTGRYQGVETLHSGRRAVVVTEDNVFVAPVRHIPRVEVGVTATVSRTSGRDTSVWAVAGSTQGIGAQMYLDGLEAGR